MRHIVITSVDRDDLDDGGALQFVRCIELIRKSSPGTTIEVLTPDFLRKDGAIEMIVAARPDVYNHNLETVPRLYPTIRPGARYYHSLRLLDRVKLRKGQPNGAALVEIADGAGVEIIATDVASEDDAVSLIDMGVDLMSGERLSAPRRLRTDAVAGRRL